MICKTDVELLKHPLRYGFCKALTLPTYFPFCILGSWGPEVQSSPVLVQRFSPAPTLMLLHHFLQTASGYCVFCTNQVLGNTLNAFHHFYSNNSLRRRFRLWYPFERWDAFFLSSILPTDSYLWGLPFILSIFAWLWFPWNFCHRENHPGSLSSV